MQSEKKILNFVPWVRQCAFGQKDKTGKRRKNTAQVRKARETKLANFLRDCRKVQGILALTLPTIDMKVMLSAAA